MNKNGKGRASHYSRAAFQITFRTSIVTPAHGEGKEPRDERAFVRNEGIASADPRVKDIAIELLYRYTEGQAARGGDDRNPC